jgi:hypothetical protein
MTDPDLKAQIAGEIYTALERLDAEEELLAIVGSWRDTLEMPKSWRRHHGRPRSGRQCSRDSYASLRLSTLWNLLGDEAGGDGWPRHQTTSIIRSCRQPRRRTPSHPVAMHAWVSAARLAQSHRGLTSAAHHRSVQPGANRRYPMRLTIAILVATVSALLLAGCFAADDSKKPLAAYSQRCEQQGFRQGTPEHAQCRLELARLANPRGATPATED